MGNCPCFGSKKRKKHKDAANKPEQTSKKFDDISSSEREMQSAASKDYPTDHSKAKTFTYRELASATNNFRSESFIGQGGFGFVYKGKLESTGQVIAVKKLDGTGFQGEKEFLVEILMLSLLHHSNLVNMIGYCAEGDQRLLVYEYMPLGSLEDHLYDLTPDKKPLDWSTRLMIAAGAAKGLKYLHCEANPPVIYRDMKSSNLLLGNDYYPKLSDFGLAKFGPGADRSHVSTRVMGTQGYCAPEYATSGKLTMKSDIYTFGVVLLELITGLKPLDDSRGHAKRFLVDWARPMLKDRKNYMQLADPLLGGQFSESIFKKTVEVASMCLSENSSKRPTSSELVDALNYLVACQNDRAAKSCTRGDEHGNMLPETSEESVGTRGKEHSPCGKMNTTLTEDNEPMKILKKEVDREQAVAEARMWGESWREKRRANDEAPDLHR